MALPNPDMNFTPFDPLTAAELNQMVANIESLYDWSAFEAGSFDIDLLPDGGITGGKIDDGAVTAAKIASEAWSTWDPTIAGGGSMSISSVNINKARYIKIGRTVHFQLYATFTTSGTASNQVTFNLPVTPENPTTPFGLSGIVVESSTIKAGAVFYSGSSQTVVVSKYDSSNYGLGSLRQIHAVGTYEAAE